jgi:hypothetical protein
MTAGFAYSRHMQVCAGDAQGPIREPMQAVASQPSIATNLGAEGSTSPTAHGNADIGLRDWSPAIWR